MCNLVIRLKTLEVQWHLCHLSLAQDTLDILYVFPRWTAWFRHLHCVAQAEVGRCGKWWRSHFLREAGGRTRRIERRKRRESQVLPLSDQSNRRRHWFLTHSHDKPSLDNRRTTGRLTHRHPLAKQSCILTSASSNTAKVQKWVHGSENNHTYTDSRRWAITTLPSLQWNSDSKSHPTSFLSPSLSPLLLHYRHSSLL